MADAKILIVDDDEDLRLGLNARLRASGYDTAFAQDGVTAVTIAKQVTPDLIILDLGLPGGDGFLVLKRIKSIASLACTPVVVLSARHPAGNRERALGAGAAAYFQKPANNDELMSSISNALTGAA